MSTAHQDVGLSAILEQFGAEGYGIYWLLLEHLAIAIDKDSLVVPVAEHSVVVWSNICHCSARKFRSFAQTATDLRLIDSRSTADLKQFSSRTLADRLQIEIPKLLKYRDEYSKKSGQTPDKLRTRADTDTDQIKTEQKGASVSNPPRWKADPDFKAFTIAALGYWVDLVDNDFEDAYFLWRTMDWEKRLKAINGIEARKIAEISSQFVVRPAKYLKTCEYNRPIVKREAQNANSPLSKQERNALAADETYERLTAERHERERNAAVKKDLRTNH